MAKILFKFNGLEIPIQCNIQDKMGTICKKFAMKIQKEEDNLYFLYDGNKIEKNLAFIEQANQIDKEVYQMIILVYEINKTIIKEDLVKSNEIICPICNENIRINIKDYKINLFNCKNGHKINNLFINEYEITQNIDQSKIICYICKKSKSESFNKEFYKCCACDINLCPLCQSIHDKTHYTINYKIKNYICEKHKDIYI